MTTTTTIRTAAATWPYAVRQEGYQSPAQHARHPVYEIVDHRDNSIIDGWLAGDYAVERTAELNGQWRADLIGTRARFDLEDGDSYIGVVERIAGRHVTLSRYSAWYEDTGEMYVSPHMDDMMSFNIDSKTCVSEVGSRGTAGHAARGTFNVFLGRDHRAFPCPAQAWLFAEELRLAGHTASTDIWDDAPVCTCGQGHEVGASVADVAVGLAAIPDTLNNVDRRCTLPGDTACRRWVVRMAVEYMDGTGSLHAHYLVRHEDTGQWRVARLDDMGSLY